MDASQKVVKRKARGDEPKKNSAAVMRPGTPVPAPAAGR
jgi:hypothetical protein